MIEADAMKAWIEGQDWRKPWGSGIASDYTANIQEVDISDSTAYEVIWARSVRGTSEDDRLRRILTRFDSTYGIPPDELTASDRTGKVSEAFEHQLFVQNVRKRRLIRRYWGYLPLMWDQLRSSIEEEHFPAHCANCGGWMTKTKRKIFHSREEDDECDRDQAKKRKQVSRAG